MKIIQITEGSREMLPYIMVEIEPSVGNIYPWERWWYEFHVWNEKEKCWEHDYLRDGWAFTLRGAILRAKEKIVTYKV